MLCFLLGISYLLPFYMLIQPVDYWNLQYTNISMEFYIVLVYVTSSFICSIGMIFVPNNVYNIRITSGLLLQAICMVLIPMIPNFYSHDKVSSSELSPSSTGVLMCTALCGLSTSLSHGSVLYLSAQLPGGIQRSLQLGMGVSPITALAIRFGTFYKYSFQDTITTTTTYFVVASILCLNVFNILEKS